MTELLSPLWSFPAEPDVFHESYSRPKQSGRENLNWNWRPDTRVQMHPSIQYPLVHSASHVWLHLPVKTTVSHSQQETRNIRVHFQNKGTKSTTVGFCTFRKRSCFSLKQPPQVRCALATETSFCHGQQGFSGNFWCRAPGKLFIFQLGNYDLWCWLEQSISQKLAGEETEQRSS